MPKIRLGLAFGGRSGEHEVSIKSAVSIRNNLDNHKYELIDIFFDKKGKFDIEKLRKVDVVFPIVHGSFGEDGCLQGLFELINLAYVGAGVLGSAVGMDKDVMKRLLLQAGIPVAGYQVLRKGDTAKINKYPVFVKPANMGSSVGVAKVHKQGELKKAIDEAFQYDAKVLIEEYVPGREMEVSVLGNDQPLASLPGEVRPTGDFYNYGAKYIDESGAVLVIPAKLDSTQVKEVQRLAVKSFKVLEGSGMARVDMFMRPDGRLVVNEINTLPGFTSISMYPKLWEASGVSYGVLLDKLVSLAVEKKKQKDKLKRSFT